MTPHVAQKAKGSARDARTTRHAVGVVTLIRCKLVEEAIAGMANVKVRGLRCVKEAMADRQLGAHAVAAPVLMLRHVAITA